MENASKALIIAGAILLAILIISLGIFIFNQASQITKSSNLSEVEILNFNEKFTSFDGTQKRGSEVNSLISRVIQNNLANRDDRSKQITINVTNASATTWVGSYQTSVRNTPPTTTNSVGTAMTGKTYNVQCTIDGTTGLVTNIDITANS